ncbi:hypothetical protein [uncultured Erythrobacter sp.]|uniref:hypothetical protein n=1 Tax=uncultured Erythrobacter sp. TaxID=263913 RepID=UPI00261E3F1A|nr:hypothetical protein [uncultured Erythrobacter sp.]
MRQFFTGVEHGLAHDPSKASVRMNYRDRTLGDHNMMLAGARPQKEDVTGADRPTSGQQSALRGAVDPRRGIGITQPVPYGHNRLASNRLETARKKTDAI